MAPKKETRQQTEKFILAKGVFQEREFPPSDQCQFYKLALDMGLAELIKKRANCNDTMVKLFYIKTRIEEKLCFTYRKCKIFLSADDIREFWKLPTVPECKFQYYRNHLLDVDWDEVLQTLAVEGATWSDKGKTQLYLERAQMTEEARIWLHFTCYNLMPLAHVSDATRERALLMYLLMTKQPVDLALLAEEHILKCANNNSARANLVFPHLITDLLLQHGAPTHDDDDWFDGMQSHIYTSGKSSKQAAERRAKKKGKRLASEADEDEEVVEPALNEQELNRRLGSFQFKLHQIIHGQNRLLAAEARRQQYIDPLILGVARHLQLSSIPPDIDSAFLPGAPGYFGPFDSAGQSSSMPGDSDPEEEEPQHDEEED